MAKTAAIEQGGGEDKLSAVKSWPDRTRDFLHDVRNEMRKVTYPSRPEVQSTTMVVLITVFAFAFYFWLVDGILRHTLDLMIHYFTRS